MDFLHTNSTSLYQGQTLWKMQIKLGDWIGWTNSLLHWNKLSIWCFFSRI